MNHRRVGRVVRLGTLTTTALLGAGLMTPAAHADPLGDARARAASLATQVTLLQQETEAATEHYNLVVGQFAEASARHSAAQASARQANQALNVAHDQVSGRTRALYISGGSLGLYAQALQADSLRGLADRVVLAQRVTQSSEAEGKLVGAAAAAARSALTTSAETAVSMAQLQRQAATEYGKVGVLLQRNQELLADADSTVTQLVSQIQAQRSSAAGEQFRALLASARVKAGQQGGLGDDVAASEVQAAAAAAIQTKLGTAYQWGGTGPSTYDCSGLTGYAYSQAGIRLPRTAAQQWLSGPHPDLADLRAGDLLFWATDVSDPATIHHVAMYAGNGLMWSTNHTGDVARLQEIYGSNEFIGATRPTAQGAAAVSPPFWQGS